MFVSKNQFYVFICCIGIGVISKILSIGFAVLKKNTKSTIIKIFSDICVFLVTTFIYIFISFILNFPSLRTYMIIGVIVGMFLYDKSLMIILAKITKRLYNIINQLIKSKRKHTNDRKQI